MDSFEPWQERMLLGVLRATSLLGLIATAWAFLNPQAELAVIVAIAGCFSLVHLLAWVPSLPYRVRAVGLTVVTLLPTLLLIVGVGPVDISAGAGIATTVLAGLIHGRRVGSAIFVLTSVWWLVAGFLVSNGYVPVPRVPDMSNFVLWVTPFINYSFCCGMVFATVLYVVDRIEGALWEERDASSRLLEEKAQLKRTQASLEATEKALQRSQTMEVVGRLAGGVAHDFNNALVVIHGWTDLLRTGVEEGELDEALDEISRAATNCSQMTRQLLTLGQRDVRSPEVLFLHEVLAQEERTLRRLLPTNVQMKTHLSPCAPVSVDPGQLQQIVLNLALNARDAMPEGGTFELSCRTSEDGTKALVEFSDTGVGIPDDVVEKVFDPFFTTKGRRGSGLGLSMVQSIMTQSDGRIVIESNVDQGTTFVLEFPTVAEQPPKKRKPSDSSIERARTVLVVEDEAAVRQIIARTLRTSGQEVLEASNADEGLEVLRRHRAEIDLLVTDGIMPGLPVWQLIQHYKEAFPRGGVLVCSGHLEDVTVRRAIELGSASFLAKPFRRADLEAAVEDALRRRRPSHDA